MGKVRKVVIDHYKRGMGVLQEFPNVNTETDAKAFIEKWCQENGHHIVAREWCGDSHWNYLEDGSEIDYTIHYE